MVNRRTKLRRINNTRKTHESDDHHQQVESRELIDYNDDLLIQILSRLPADSIVRFKSVSKHWQSLLSHREFTLPYDRLSVLRVHGIFYGSSYVHYDTKNPNQNCPLSRRSPYFHPSSHGIRIVQSCNGLLLCSIVKEIERAREYYVFNPTTNQLEIVQSIKEGRAVGTRIRFVGLVYHPTEGKHYKLVCMYIIETSRELRVQIYSSDIKRWKLLSDVYTKYNYPPTFKHGAYVDGGIYWAPFGLFAWHPYYFNLEEEKLQKLKLLCPLDPYAGQTVYYFGESRGHFHMVVMIRCEGGLYLRIYEMMSDHSGWVVMFQILIEEFLAEFLRTHYFDYSFFKVLDVVRGEKEGDTFLVLKFPGEIRSYNLLEKSYNKLFDVPTTIEGRTMKAHRYIQTIGLF
ncbi:F-box protein At5g07610-like [Rutidosis leptorrhynchoides]|uniref:F-box protein At5g07610-like n=1 Tax=Rutidosis leptorrhynchoides TaxID=125765 RepID=UPI003A98EDC9